VARPWRYLVMAVVAAVGLSTASCAAGPTDSEGLTADGLVPFINLGDYAPGAQPQRNFNPFSPNKAVVGYTFETLYQVDGFNCAETPWLATEYAWDGTQKLTFTLREGVKWHDGKPFTAEDVVFTYEMIKQYPALDTMGIGPTLTSVTAAGNQVIMEFAKPAVLLFSKVAKVEIVPKHIWANAGDPVRFTNTDAIGTGPYRVKTFNARQMVLERDPGYWQADKIKVQELRFTHSPEGQVDQLRLERGEYDMNSMFVPEIDEVYVSKDPEHNKYWFAPGGVISLYPNLTKAPFDDAAFRRALVPAFDRQGIADKAQFGYVETASQTGLILPNQEEWLDPDIEDGGHVKTDVEAAKSALDDAGYTVDGEGRRLGRDGQPLSFEFKVPAGWNDWIQAAQIIRSDFDKLGIQVDVTTPQQATYEQDRGVGNYDLLFGVYGGDCNIHKDFADPLASAQSADVGKVAVSNFSRWRDPETDGLLDDLQVAGDEETQHRTVHELQRVMMEDVPNIPLWYGAKWFQYRTARVTGWPSAEDPYAVSTDVLLIITRLQPAGS
jgi:peptide/nickel transport system substrate-binding protein